ncbi:peptidase M61 [Phenylobacterium sp.]|uniref:M61 family metallopeptidase n=1 Tax=Phenylobacterium sp. TaxID=1871053 RepID=UPI0025FCEBCA|nr:peptidase M61 [Phenylobacterium sp.]
MTRPLAPAAAPLDRPFPGRLQLTVDATDTDHKVYRVHEVVTLAAGRPVTLFYPQWETASHAPTGSVAALAGLTVTANGRPVRWRRDPVNVFAFHLDLPPAARRFEVDFQFLAPTRPGALTMTPDIVTVPWQSLVLYPAGWYVRDIPVEARVRLPDGFQAGTSLDVTSTAGGLTAYAPVSLETLVDSPVYAGRWFSRVELAPLDGAPMRLDLVADAPGDLALPPDTRSRLDRLAHQAEHVFGPPHFSRYDALVSLSDALPDDGGTEHLRSAENNFGPQYLTHPEQHLLQHDLLAHELAHSWNGKFRIPARLWTPDFNTPSRDDLLWVYEGQTQYWGIVLAARSGLRTRNETLDLLAAVAARAEARASRRWKPLSDSVNDPIYDAGHGTAWPDWQGREDYYGDGVLLWLDVDTLILERTAGRRSLDDFARRFFAVDGRSEVARTYGLADVCAALNAVTPLDWAAFFRERLDAHDAGRALDGVRRGGYRLAYSAAPTETFRQGELEEGGPDLMTSLGVQMGKMGVVRRLAWEGPAFNAGLGIGARITAVDGTAYSDEALTGALRRDAGGPLRLDFEQDGRARTASVIGAGAPRYPRLEPIPGAVALVDKILDPAP